MAQITEKIVEIKAQVEGGNTVKELKEQIAELTRLMDTLDKESVEYHNTVDMLVDAEEELTNVMKVGKSQLSAQEGSYNALVNRMAALKKAHKAVSDEASRSRLSDEINKINEELKDMDAKNGVYVRNVGNYENAVKKALKTPQQELKALRLELAQLEEGTAEYNAVFARMAQLTHDVTEQQEMLKWSSADLGDILGNVAGVAQGIAGGFSALNAVSGLISGGNEDVEKAMLTTQRWLQLIQGLGALEELGDRLSGLWKGLKTFIQSQNTAVVSMGEFEKKTITLTGTTAESSQELEEQAQTMRQTTNVTQNLTTATERLNAAHQDVTGGIKGHIRLLKDRLAQEEKVLAQLEEEDSLNTEAIKNSKLKITELNRFIKRQEDTLANIIKSNKATKEKIKLEKEDAGATNAASVATKGFTLSLKGAWAGVKALALSIKTALISTGIGLLIVALGTALSWMWKFINGSAKAEKQTKALADANEVLNESLEAQDKTWERQEKLMRAQGKSYEEIYQAEMKYLQGKLKEVQMTLATQQAIAKEIGERKLQKERYDEFREELQNLVDLEKELKTAIEDLNWDKYVEEEKKKTDALKEQTKAEEERKKKATEAYEARMKELENERKNADKLYKDLIQYYKDEKTKLKEKYEEEKALLEKYGKDTTLLTKKYEEDKTKIVLKEEEARKKLREQYEKDLDASFRNPSLEYFEHQLDKATAKLEDFKDVNKQIVRDENGMHTLSGYADALKIVNDEYGVGIQNLSHFDLVFEKVKMDFEDAQKALDEFVSGERVKQIEKEFEAINNVMEAETEKKQIEYDLYASQGTWYNGFTNNYITQMKRRWETEDSIFQLRKAKIQEEIELYRKASTDENLTDEARGEAQKKLADLERQLALETADYTIAQNQRKAEASENYVATVQDSLDGISSILSNVASAWETSIQAQVDAGEISEEEGERQMENMRGIQSAIALINAFSSAVSAYNSMASIPFVGPALGAAAAAAALASGLMQVKAINAVKKGDKGGGDSTRYAEVTPQLPDYNPTAVTNVTGGQETENLANAMSGANLWVSVKDIDSAQSKVKTRDKETSF